jgi:hypothetical protein
MNQTASIGKKLYDLNPPQFFLKSYESKEP